MCDEHDADMRYTSLSPNLTHCEVDAPARLKQLQLNFLVAQ